VTVDDDGDLAGADGASSFMASVWRPA